MIAIVLYFFITLAANGGVSYIDVNGNLASETAIRDCRQWAQEVPTAPTSADSFQPGGMERSAERHQALVDQCFAKQGFKRKV